MEWEVKNDVLMTHQRIFRYKDTGGNECLLLRISTEILPLIEAQVHGEADSYLRHGCNIT